jgi:hypothetical protein
MAYAAGMSSTGAPDGPDAPDRVALAPDESILWMDHPRAHLAKYWIGGATGVVLLGLGAVPFLPATWGWLGWLVVLGGLAVGGYAFLGYYTVRYVVTSNQAHRKTGIVRTGVETLPLDRIRNARCSGTALQRLLDRGDLHVTTDGGGSSALVFRCVPTPATVNVLLIDGAARAAASPRSA